MDEILQRPFSLGGVALPDVLDGYWSVNIRHQSWAEREKHNPSVSVMFSAAIGTWSFIWLYISTSLDVMISLASPVAQNHVYSIYDRCSVWFMVKKRY